VFNFHFGCFYASPEKNFCELSWCYDTVAVVGDSLYHKALAPKPNASCNFLCRQNHLFEAAQRTKALYHWKLNQLCWIQAFRKHETGPSNFGLTETIRKLNRKPLRIHIMVGSIPSVAYAKRRTFRIQTTMSQFYCDRIFTMIVPDPNNVAVCCRMFLVGMEKDLGRHHIVVRRLTSPSFARLQISATW